MLSPVLLALAPGYAGALDIVPGAVVAYGQRALSGATLGQPLYTIRRDSDDTTQSFSSDATTGDAPVAAISSFIGAGNGFIDTWNDQSGGGWDVAQADTAVQPEWNASVIGSRPGLVSTVATIPPLTTASQGIALRNGAATVFVVANADAQVFLTWNARYLDFYTGRTGQLPYIDLNDALGDEAGGTYPAFAPISLIDAAWQFGSADFKVNGVSQTQTASLDDQGPVAPLSNLASWIYVHTGLAGAPASSSLCEVIVYPTLLSDANRLALRQNIAAYYGITVP